MSTHVTFGRWLSLIVLMGMLTAMLPTAQARAFADTTRFRTLVDSVDAGG